MSRSGLNDEKRDKLGLCGDTLTGRIDDKIMVIHTCDRHAGHSGRHEARLDEIKYHGTVVVQWGADLVS